MRKILVRLVKSDPWYFFLISPIFIITFVIFLAVTLAYPELPPGIAVSDAFGMDPTVEWSGFPVIRLSSAMFNGVVYGVIIWLVLFLGLTLTYKGD